MTMVFILSEDISLRSVVNWRFNVPILLINPAASYMHFLIIVLEPSLNSKMINQIVGIFLYKYMIIIKKYDN